MYSPAVSSRSAKLTYYFTLFSLSLIVLPVTHKQTFLTDTGTENQLSLYKESENIYTTTTKLEINQMLKKGKNTPRRVKTQGFHPIPIKRWFPSYSY